MAWLTWLTTSRCFNEAAALKPRKPLGVVHLDREADEASMRPRH